MKRKIFNEDALHSAIRESTLTAHLDIIEEVTTAIQQHRIVVVGMRWNDAVWQARKNLKKAGLDFEYLEYGSYTSQWRRRLALKMWTGWPTFPMIFIDQTLIGGNADLKTLLASGELS